jgi:hypothetical protein
MMLWLEQDQMFVALFNAILVCIVEKTATGNAKDVVALSVSGTIMVTKRSTLCTAEDSVLAQQFDDSEWTEQGCNAPRVNEWMPDQMSVWAKSIYGLPEEVSSILHENEMSSLVVHKGDTLTK